MNILDTYFSIMGGSPPPRPVYTPPPPPKPAPVDNSAAARQKAAENKRRGRSDLIANKGGASGLGDDASGQKKTLGGN
tara:strand:+ start:1547 stop:1780 length:234 start_codon:yes stop_codon:yes gene_type:complete